MDDKSIIENTDQGNDLALKEVMKKISINYAIIQTVIATNRYSPKEEKLKRHQECALENDHVLKAFNADTPLKAMLVEQMQVVHDLQQMSYLYAKKCEDSKHMQSGLNNMAKLSNIFIQQASLLHKLQGHGQQVTVEHVHVHNGGQAVVGSIESINGGRGK